MNDEVLRVSKQGIQHLQKKRHDNGMVKQQDFSNATARLVQGLESLNPNVTPRVNGEVLQLILILIIQMLQWDDSD